MSVANTRLNKRIRSATRAVQKDQAAEKIAHEGVIVTKKVVKNHRYLKAHGLGHSKTIAAVHIHRSITTKRRDEDVDLDRASSLKRNRKPRR